MQPRRLSLKNFCGHSETEFSFDDFSSALVIGKVKDNDRFSNGAGKSTIFNAIEYVLFNEIHFSTLEKVIRDGCDVSRVEFEFTSSLDKATYRIVRSNSRKTGTDVRLFKALGETWEDLTQRRVSDTEREIVKIVGFNYKAFCASVLFSQAGSENNVQRDFGNLPALTPEKRKSILREVLQLNIYSNYEKLAKTKFATVESSLSRQKIVLSTIGDPDAALIDLNKNIAAIESMLVIDNEHLTHLKKKTAEVKVEYASLSEKVMAVRGQINEGKRKVSSCDEQVVRHTKTVSDLKSKISLLPEEAKGVQKQIDDANVKLESLKGNKVDLLSIKDELSKVSEKVQNTRVSINTIANKIVELDKPISDDDTCTKCHQSVPEQHKHSWREKINEEVQKLKSQKATLEDELKILSATKLKLDADITSAAEKMRLTSDLESKVKYLTSDLESKRSLYKNYNSLLEEHVGLLKEKTTDSGKARQELEVLLLSDADASTVQMLETLSGQIRELSTIERDLTASVSKLIGDQAIIKHRISECESNKKKIVDIKKDIQQLEKSLLLHSKVIQAFGSGGIPSLITNSILDELQEEANKWLLKLRPGLQLQFIVVNSKSKKEQEDTLDILYFIDGNEREYKQLSGAQKIVVSLAIKLGLLFIMNKRLGVDIKLMLLDEVDQALDPGSTEIFADIIRILQEEFKVMVITHDDDLKHKFSHAILVEQDENNSSTGKLINW
jgi:DNA repair protein SbcC/Rad50